MVCCTVAGCRPYLGVTAFSFLHEYVRQRHGSEWKLSELDFAAIILGCCEVVSLSCWLCRVIAFSFLCLEQSKERLPELAVVCAAEKQECSSSFLSVMSGADGNYPYRLHSSSSLGLGS